VLLTVLTATDYPESKCPVAVTKTPAILQLPLSPADDLSSLNSYLNALFTGTRLIRSVAHMCEVRWKWHNIRLPTHSF